MKTLVYTLMLLLPAYFVIQGCNKANDLAANKGKLIASKTSIKINEPDSLELVGASASDSIKWTVTPSGFDTLLIKNNTALIKFTKAGTYTVKASDNGAAPASIDIKVNDSVYVSGTRNITIPLSGDQITLTPYYFKSTKSDTSYIYFKAKTAGYYCNQARLNVTSSIGAGNAYNINFINVLQYESCTAGTSQLQAGIVFNQKTTAALTEGTYPLNINLNGTTYSGSIVVSSATATFNWNYSSGVVIATKQLTR